MLKKLFIFFILFGFCLPSYSYSEESYNLLLEQYKNNEIKRALKTIKKIDLEGNLDAKISLLKYEIYRRANKLSEAKLALLDAIKYDPECFEAYIGLTIISIQNNDPKSAKNYLKEAIEIEPQLNDSPDILYYLAKICILDKDFNLAKEYILQAIELNRDEKEYYLELGKIYLFQKDYLKAVNALSFLLGGNDFLEAEASNYIGLANYKRGNYSQAVNYFEKAVKINSNSFIYLNNLAICYKSIQDNENFKKTVETILNLTPEFPEDYIQLSTLYLDRGNFEAAKNALEEGIKNYPDNLLLKELLNKLNKTQI